MVVEVKQRLSEIKFMHQLEAMERKTQGSLDQKCIKGSSNSPTSYISIKNEVVWNDKHRDTRAVIDSICV